MNGHIGNSSSEIDPVTFKIIKHRMSQVTEEAVEALKRVSGSATTNEGHDLMVALYNRDGSLLTGGVGFLHHYVGASEATKAIIETFEGNIHEGDIFLLNDPYTAALHPPDVYIITPVYSQGKLRGFAANFVHVADLGAIDPGGFPPSARSVYHEGFQTPGVKLADQGEIRDDILETILNMSREPERVELDIRSQIAANNVAVDRMQAMMDQYGPEVVEQVGSELVSRSQNQFRQRLRNLPDGEFQQRQYIESPPEDEIYKVKLTLRKEGDSLEFDFSGTDRQSGIGINCTDTGALGGVAAPIFPLMCHDMVWNDGILDQVTVTAPKGSLVNAQKPAPVSIATVATIQVCNSLSTLAISKLQGSEDEFIDRTTAVWHGAHCGIGLKIVSDSSTSSGMISDTFAGAGGGKYNDDGVTLGGEVPNLVTRWANVERHESDLPLLFLGRRLSSDSGGAGDNRGGLGHEFAITPVPDSDVNKIEARVTGRGIDVPPSLGIFGGQPGPTVKYSLVKDSNVGSEISFPDPADDSRELDWGTYSIEDNDAFYIRAPGSGGFGDPLNREPERILRDLNQGFITPDTAEKLYGIPITEEGKTPERPAIESHRERVRENRAQDDFEPVLPTEECTETTLRFGPHISVLAHEEGLCLCCERCDEVICYMEPDWKSNTVINKYPISEVAIHNDVPEEFETRLFCCPSCGQMFDSEVARTDDPYLATVVHK